MRLPEVSTLLDPLSEDTFRSSIWLQRPFHIKGSPEKIRRLFGGPLSRRDFVDGMLEAEKRRSPGVRLVAHASPGLGADSAESDPSYVIAARDIERELACGRNVQGYQPASERVMRVVAQLKSQLDFPGNCKVAMTLSPAGFGWPLHFDPVDTLILQIEGTKRFMVSELPVVARPHFGARFRADGSVYYDDPGNTWPDLERIDVSALREIVLEPGDVLHCPAGVVHGTSALNESLTLILDFEQRSTIDLIVDVLRDQLASDPAWRQAPLGGPHPPGDLAWNVYQYFDARLGDLRKALESIRPGDIAQRWFQAAANPGEATQASMPAADTSLPEIQLEDRFSVGTQQPVKWCWDLDPDGNLRILVLIREETITGEDQYFELLDKIAQSSSFTADDARRWGQAANLSWDEVKDALATLAGHGVLQRETEPHEERRMRSSR
jgi:ribosomal protein L16 Arg81 hydroxylase